jgi:hypothetical protein
MGEVEVGQAIGRAAAAADAVEEEGTHLQL